MIHIDDVVDAWTLAINRLEEKRQSEGPSGLEIYNIATGVSSPVIGLIRKTLALTQSSSPIRIISGDDRFPDTYVGGTTKAKNVLGFEARIGQDEGLHRLASAYLRDTIDYLERNTEVECDRPKMYSADGIRALNGCSGTVAVEGSGQIGYLYMSDGSEGQDDIGVHWGWRDDVEPQVWQFIVDKRAAGNPVIRFARTDHLGRQSFFEAQEEGRILGGETRFLVTVDSTNGYVNLILESSGKPLQSPYIEMKPVMQRRQIRPHRFRLTPFCCPGKPAPWPFFEEDPLASSINDLRFEIQRNFTASQVQTKCRRLAEAGALTQAKLNRIHSYPYPIQLEQTPLPTGSPSEWRLRDLRPCTNLCDHPTTCLDTGTCACSQPSCTTRNRFPFASYTYQEGLSYPPPTVRWDALSVFDPDALVNQVGQSSWLNVLRLPARRYLSRNPKLPYTHLTRIPESVQADRIENAHDYDQLRSTGFGCFSADAVMERAVALINQEYTDDSLAFLPFYAGTSMAGTKSVCSLPLKLYKLMSLVPTDRGVGRRGVGEVFAGQLRFDSPDCAIHLRLGGMQYRCSKSVHSPRME